MSVFTASLRREWGRLRASPWDWAMVSWVPLLTLALMCWIFSAGQPYRLPIALGVVALMVVVAVARHYRAKTRAKTKAVKSL